MIKYTNKKTIKHRLQFESSALYEAFKDYIMDSGIPIRSTHVFHTSMYSIFEFSTDMVHSEAIQNKIQSFKKHALK